MMRFVMPIVISAAALAATPATAADITASPSGKWTVALEERGCTLFREFASGDDQYSLHLTPDPAAGGTELVVLRKERSDDGFRVMQAHVSLDGGESYLLPELRRNPRNTGWTRYGMMLDSAEPLRSVDRGLAVSAGKYLGVEFVTGVMGPALAALDQCSAGEG